MKLLLLDRDGVINYDSDDYIKSPDEWRPIPGSLEAIAKLKHAGWSVAVASNQSGLARGYFSQTTLDAIHQKIQDALALLDASIDAFFICPHHPNDGCDCRKPKPGLLLQAQIHFGCALQHVPFVGDSWRDIEAAQAAGAQGILVTTGNGQKHIKEANDHHIPVYADLAAAIEALLKNQ
jgi:D-glycero-D-manno-heptose 1,7-bisphosphate phosphatase